MASCFARLCSAVCISKDDHGEDDEDSLLWNMDLPSHSCGDFSMAVVQANEVMEDHSQVETGLNAIFVGIYDGHMGPEASTFINDHLFDNLLKTAKLNDTIDERILGGAVRLTELDFRTLVARNFEINPRIATVGSSCLVGVIWKGTLYIANVGDSRAVIGYTAPAIGWRVPAVIAPNVRWRPPGAPKRIVAKQLTTEHSVKVDLVREEYRNSHRSPLTWSWTKKAWLVQGLLDLQVSRSIGDIHLKRKGYSVNLPAPFDPPDPRNLPVLTAEPSLCSRVFQPKDKFLIFASAGLWEHISNQEAAEIVYKYPRIGIARRLIKAAQKAAAYKKYVNKRELLKTPKGPRREYHDDITVIVVYVDHELLGKKVITAPELSYKGFVDSFGPSKFFSLRDLM